MTEVRTGRRPKLSIKGFGYIVIAAVIVVGVPAWLLYVGEVWAQIVAGIFIAAIIIPVLLAVIAWSLLRSELANYRAAQEREEEARALAAEEARMRRARSRQGYVGPDGLPKP